MKTQLNTITRVPLTSPTGAWFDVSKAEKFRDESFWDGRNWVSLATNSSTESQNLYKTASGKYILHSTSRWQGVTDKYILLSCDEAAEWFAKQDFPFERIPEELHVLISKLEV